MRKITFHFISLLRDADPRVRGYAARILGALGPAEAREDLEKIQGESHEVPFYENGRIEKKTVGQVALEALGKV
jgi:hypothetical protein